MEITCPNCGQTCEVDEEPAIGQHLLCPFCDMNFNYTPQNTTENDSYSIANTTETNVDAPTAKIQATCPHCGATYEVDAEHLGEGARQVKVYEDEMIRQRARQGMPLW